MTFVVLVEMHSRVHGLEEPSWLVDLYLEWFELPVVDAGRMEREGMNREPVVDDRENIVMLIPSDCCAHLPQSYLFVGGGRTCLCHRGLMERDVLAIMSTRV